MIHLEKILNKLNVSFFTGVPDSLLKPLCNYLIDTYGISKNHIIATNEGNAVAIAAGYHLSTGKTPCVYLQNSGLGNIINPLASLLNDRVYGIPCVFIIGWRGEPNVYDEPQHVFQGEVTLETLDIMDIEYIVIDKNINKENIDIRIKEFNELLKMGKSVAFVVKKGALIYDKEVIYKNEHTLLREDALKVIADYAKEDIVVATTGKTSRELFEIRENNEQSHKYDFLTVGSMGHSSSIALGIAIQKPNTRVWCIDGDGAVLMHMGSIATIGSIKPNNFIHVIINNCAHESVGGLPTVANTMNFQQIAFGCGYKYTYHIDNLEELSKALADLYDKHGPILIEVKVSIASRDDLRRPTSTPIENKEIFMNYLRECD